MPAWSARTQVACGRAQVLCWRRGGRQGVQNWPSSTWSFLAAIPRRWCKRHRKPKTRDPIGNATNEEIRRHSKDCSNDQSLTRINPTQFDYFVDYIDFRAGEHGPTGSMGHVWTA